MGGIFNLTQLVNSEVVLHVASAWPKRYGILTAQDAVRPVQALARIRLADFSCKIFGQKLFIRLLISEYWMVRTSFPLGSCLTTLNTRITKS